MPESSTATMRGSERAATPESQPIFLWPHNSSRQGSLGNVARAARCQQCRFGRDRGPELHRSGQVVRAVAVGLDISDFGCVDDRDEPLRRHVLRKGRRRRNCAFARCWRTYPVCLSQSMSWRGSPPSAGNTIRRAGTFCADCAAVRRGSDGASKTCPPTAHRRRADRSGHLRANRDRSMTAAGARAAVAVHRPP